MQRLVLVAGLGSVMLCSNALAQDADTDTDTDGKQEEALSPTEQVKRLADGELTYEELSDDVQTAIAAVSDLRAADRTGRLAALMALLAALFKILLSGVKALKGFTFWKRRQAATIRITTLMLGIGVFLFSNLMAGMPWWEALMLSLSGPGSMVMHEYSRLFSKEESVA